MSAAASRIASAIAIGAVGACSIVCHSTLAAKAEGSELIVRPRYDGPGLFSTVATPARFARTDIAALVDRHADLNSIPRSIFHRLIKRESGYNPRAVGPVTNWGRAYGIGQMLCSTARGLGEPDCGRLVRDPDRALSLSARYVRQGYDATGSWHGAAAYYHGGPNRAIHGRKTAAYARAVAGQVYVARSPAFAPGQLFLRGGA